MTTSAGRSAIRLGLRGAALLPGGQGEADRTAKASHCQVELGAQPAAAPAKGLIFSPLLHQRRVGGRG